LPAFETALPARIGARTLFTLRRRLVRRRLSLEEAMASGPPPLPLLAGEDDGYLITALPAAWAGALAGRQDGLKPFVRQRYARCYARLDQAFDAYLAAFSAKSRSTLKRKAKKLAERSGGALDVRCYAGAEELEEFHRLARPLSAKTYQERLLDAGLPDGPEALAAMRALAGQGRVRAWLLFVEGRAIAYLYAPAEGAALIYAHLGYDPEFADYSPGTVLQLEAMRQLMAERAFPLFDFTEGEGRHKSLFATGTVECVDLLLVRPSVANLVAGHALAAFDGGVALAKTAAGALGLERALGRLRR
jgi:CelD/BcsL family acetyltransferase involved in cellulose biosynthesis